MQSASAATDAANWDEAGDPAPPAPQLQIAPQDAKKVMSALNRIQILAETLSETTLDAMQVELVGALIDSGMDLRRTLLGAAAEPAPADSDVVYLEDEFELGATGLHEEDFRDFEEDLFLYEESLPYTPPQAPFSESDESMLDVEEVEAPFSGLNCAPQALNGPLRGLRVMLVDANPIQVVAVTNLLRELGADAAPVAAEFASHTLKHGRYDAALVDMQSAARIGLSLVRVLRVASNMREERAAIFAILPHATPEQIRDCIAAGADGWLPRPPSRTNLLEQLEVLAIEKSFDQEAA